MIFTKRAFCFAKNEETYQTLRLRIKGLLSSVKCKISVIISNAAVENIAVGG